MVSGTEAHADALRDEVAAVLSPMGLCLSEEKTTVVHIDQGLDFLGFRVQRRLKAGTAKRYVYTYPSKKALLAICAKVRALTRRSNQLLTLEALLHRLNQVLRGWCNYHRHGSAAATFRYLNCFTWRRVTRWLRGAHKGITWRSLRRRFLQGWRPTAGTVTLFYPYTVPIVRYRYRGTRIPTPWSSVAPGSTG
jgi:RNA-directed DNA polymerase